MSKCHPSVFNHGSELRQVCCFSHSNLSYAACRLITDVDSDDDKDLNNILWAVSPEETVKMHFFVFWPELYIFFTSPKAAYNPLLNLRRTPMIGLRTSGTLIHKKTFGLLVN